MSGYTRSPSRPSSEEDEPAHRRRSLSHSRSPSLPHRNHADDPLPSIERDNYGQPFSSSPLPYESAPTPAAARFSSLSSRGGHEPAASPLGPRTPSLEVGSSLPYFAPTPGAPRFSSLEPTPEPERRRRAEQARRAGIEDHWRGREHSQMHGGPLGDDGRGETATPRPPSATPHARTRSRHRSHSRPRHLGVVVDQRASVAARWRDRMARDPRAVTPDARERYGDYGRGVTATPRSASESTSRSTTPRAGEYRSLGRAAMLAGEGSLRRARIYGGGF